MESRPRIIEGLAVTFLSLSLFAGCGDEPISPQERLAGTWDCTSMKVTRAGTTEEFMDLEGTSIVLTFTPTGNYSWHSTILGVSESFSGSFSATNSTITLNRGEDRVELTYDYSISDNVLTMTGANDVYDVDLTFLKA